MAKKLLNGNQAIALGALASGVSVVCGYPGTPSSEVIGSIYNREDLADLHIEWSTNEKVAIEVAGGVSWAGKRSLCTMKMSGVNVAYDSLIGIAYSGINGGMVVYVADDPGVTTGMCEQDTREFAQMSDMVVLEPSCVQECYDFTKLAFEISELIGEPVFVRGVTNTSQSYAVVEYEDRVLPEDKEPLLEKDITKYTKAGAAICTNQHLNLIASLAKAEEIIRGKGLNQLSGNGKIGIVAVGVANTYIKEAVGILQAAGAKVELSDFSHLKLIGSLPFASQEVGEILQSCDKLVVLEELAPVLEKEIYRLAYRLGVRTEIIGKTDGTLSRLGEYNGAIVAKALAKAIGFELPAAELEAVAAAETLCAQRPITNCSGCPHRGSYIAINQAIKNWAIKKTK